MRPPPPPPPHPPTIVEDETYPNKLYIIGKGIYRRVRFILDINKIFSLDQPHEMSNYGAARRYFMNVWSLGTSASPLTAIEVIPVPPECLRSFLTKYKQVKPKRIVSVFTSRASPTNLCLHVLLLDEVTFSITQALTPWSRTFY